MLGYAANMFRLLLIITLCYFPLQVSAGKFYKWVDERGVTHYDEKKPQHDAEERDLPNLPPASPTAPYSAQTGDAEDADDAETGVGYSKFEIGTPEQDATIRSNEGAINVSLFIAPGLRAGHKIVVALDGQKLKDKLSSTQFSLKDLPRGTHTLKASIVDDKGQTLASTKVVSFHLRKHSILHPPPK